GWRGGRELGASERQVTAALRSRGRQLRGQCGFDRRSIEALDLRQEHAAVLAAAPANDRAVAHAVDQRPIGGGGLALHAGEQGWNRQRDVGEAVLHVLVLLLGGHLQVVVEFLRIVLAAGDAQREVLDRPETGLVQAEGS